MKKAGRKTYSFENVLDLLLWGKHNLRLVNNTIFNRKQHYDVTGNDVTAVVSDSSISYTLLVFRGKYWLVFLNLLFSLVHHEKGHKNVFYGAIL